MGDVPMTDKTCLEYVISYEDTYSNPMGSSDCPFVARIRHGGVRARAGLKLYLVWSEGCHNPADRNPNSPQRYQQQLF